MIVLRVRMRAPSHASIGRSYAPRRARATWRRTRECTLSVWMWMRMRMWMCSDDAALHCAALHCTTVRHSALSAEQCTAATLYSRFFCVATL